LTKIKHKLTTQYSFMWVERSLTRRFSVALRREFSSVGFVGLGRMGLPMAKNLVKSTAVVAFDTNPIACEDARQSGIHIADSIAAVGTSDSQVLFTMLPGDLAFNQVMTEWQGSFDKKRYIVNCSTVSPSTSKRWAENFRANGGHSVLDAPVSGGTAGATNGTLSFMVGCEDENDLQVVQSYLDVMGQRTIHCGKAGAGSATKLCNNLALATQMVGICEALSLGEKLGIDPIVLSKVMNTSTAKCWSCEVNNPHPAVAQSLSHSPPACNDYKGGFATNLMLKDLKLALQAAGDEDLSLPLTATTKELYHLAQKHGLGELDFGVILQFLRGQDR
jgi:3-hydroxyisobutyrate dehydrogenase